MEKGETAAEAATQLSPAANMTNKNQHHQIAVTGSKEHTVCIGMERGKRGVIMRKGVV